MSQSRADLLSYLDQIKVERGKERQRKSYSKFVVGAALSVPRHKWNDIFIFNSKLIIIALLAQW